MFSIYNQFVFLALIIISTHSFDLGYLYRRDSNSEKRQCELFTKYLSEKDSNIVIHDSDYDGTISGFVGALTQMIIRNPFDIVFVYCTDAIMKMNKAFIESQNKIIWCVNTYNYGSCHHNFVTGNSIISPLKESIYIYLIIYSGFSYISFIILSEYSSWN